MSVRLILSVTLLAAVVAAPQAQESLELPAEFTAFAVSTGGPRTSSVATNVDITIDRWSTPEETQRLMGLLKEKDTDELLDALRDMKSVGTINTPGNLAYDLRYAHHEPAPDGGRRIFLATDRPISYWEAVNRPRVSNYPFTFIELRMNGKGEGEGKLALATKIGLSRDGKVIELVNYAAQPIQLNQVQLRGN
jgi:hypothetical protein